MHIAFICSIVRLRNFSLSLLPHCRWVVGGVFVSASLGRVGINDASGNYESNLHIKGGLTSDRLVAPYSGKKGDCNSKRVSNALNIAK